MCFAHTKKTIDLVVWSYSAKEKSWRSKTKKDFIWTAENSPIENRNSSFRISEWWSSSWFVNYNSLFSVISFRERDGSTKWSSSTWSTNIRFRSLLSRTNISIYLSIESIDIRSSQYHFRFDWMSKDQSYIWCCVLDLFFILTFGRSNGCRSRPSLWPQGCTPSTPFKKLIFTFTS